MLTNGVASGLGPPATSQMFFAGLLRRGAEALGVPIAAVTGVKAIISKTGRHLEADAFAAVIVEDMLNEILSTTARVKIPRVPAAGVDKTIELPFGLKVDLDPSAPVAPDLANNEGGSDDDSDVIPEKDKTGTDDEHSESSESEDLPDEPPVEPPPAPPPPAPPPVVEPPAPMDKKLVGVQAWDWAPTAKAPCFVCKAPCPAGSLRMIYRVKPGRSFADERRIHTGCFSREHLPAASRELDMERIRTMLLLPGLSAEARLLLQGCLDRR